MSNQSSTLRGGRNRKFKSEINVVPYIDVMLVLLVIFMVVAPMADPSVINLPTAGKSTQPPTEYIQITLRPDARPTIGIVAPNKGSAGKPVTASDSRDLIVKLDALYRQKKLPVMISADKDIKYDVVIQAISEAKKLGIDRVGLATR